MQPYKMDDSDIDHYDLKNIEKRKPKDYNQFRENEELNQRKTDYDFDKYTVPLKKENQHSQ